MSIILFTALLFLLMEIIFICSVWNKMVEEEKYDNDNRNKQNNI